MNDYCLIKDVNKIILGYLYEDIDPPIDHLKWSNVKTEETYMGIYLKGNNGETHIYNDRTKSYIIIGNFSTCPHVKTYNNFNKLPVNYRHILIYNAHNIANIFFERESISLFLKYINSAKNKNELYMSTKNRCIEYFNNNRHYIRNNPNGELFILNNIKYNNIK